MQWRSLGTAQSTARGELIMSAYHLNGIFGNSGANSNGTVHPGGKFSEKKAIPFEVFLFSRFDRNSPEISVPFAHSYSARLFTVILPRKNAKDLKDGGRFSKRLSLQFVSLLVGSVADILEENCNPAGENELFFVVCTCVFFCFRDSGFQRASAWATLWEKMWMLIADFPDEMWMLQQPKEEIFAFLYKQKAIF